MCCSAAQTGGPRLPGSPPRARAAAQLQQLLQERLNSDSVTTKAVSLQKLPIFLKLNELKHPRIVGLSSWLAYCTRRRLWSTHSKKKITIWKFFFEIVAMWNKVLCLDYRQYSVSTDSSHCEYYVCTCRLVCSPNIQRVQYSDYDYISPRLLVLIIVDRVLCLPVDYLRASNAE